MDNLTHTMVGATLGEAGLKKLTGLGMATLMIAANIPDLDVLVIPFSDELPFRRGWTHGPLGLLVLPALLACAMILLDRYQTRIGKRPPKRLPIRPWQLLLLAYLGALTHPFFDWLNTYGIRLLMPFSHEWYFGDAVFIVDPWLWILLAGGIYLARRRSKRELPGATRPALITLLVATLYISLMIGGSRTAHHAAHHAIEERGLGPIHKLMAGPIAVNPFKREIIYDRGPEYGRGMVTFTPSPDVWLNPEMLPKMDDNPYVLEAVNDPSFQRFLYWSRFPIFGIEEEGDSVRVYVSDLRFSDSSDSWARRSVVLER